MMDGLRFKSARALYLPHALQVSGRQGRPSLGLKGLTEMSHIILIRVYAIEGRYLTQTLALNRVAPCKIKPPAGSSLFAGPERFPAANEVRKLTSGDVHTTYAGAEGH